MLRQVMAAMERNEWAPLVAEHTLGECGPGHCPRIEIVPHPVLFATG
jgi:hypothetical protein